MQINWTGEAVRHAGLVTRKQPPENCGVGDSDEPGVSFVWAPIAEQTRVQREMDSAGIKVLGIGNSEALRSQTHIVAMMVESADVPLLLKIVHKLPQPPQPE